MGFYYIIRTVYKIEHNNLYNIDEYGITLGICDITKVLARSGKKKTYRKELSMREWMSVIKDVSATGLLLRPIVMFKGKIL